MRYRKLKVGEIIARTDEYISVHTPDVYGPVNNCSIGQKLLACNVPYYRRPIKNKS